MYSIHCELTDEVVYKRHTLATIDRAIEITKHLLHNESDVGADETACGIVWMCSRRPVTKPYIS